MECILKILNIIYEGSHYCLINLDQSTVLENRKTLKPNVILNYYHPNNIGNFFQINFKIKLFNYLKPYFPIISIYLTIYTVSQFAANFIKMANSLISRD